MRRWPKGRPRSPGAHQGLPERPLLVQWGPKRSTSQKPTSRRSALFPRDPGSQSWKNRGKDPQKQLEPVGERKGDLEDEGQGRCRRGQKRIARQAGKGGVGKLGREVCAGEAGKRERAESAQIPRGRRRAGSGRALGRLQWARGRASGEARERGPGPPTHLRLPWRGAQLTCPLAACAGPGPAASRGAGRQRRRAPRSTSRCSGASSRRAARTGRGGVSTGPAPPAGHGPRHLHPRPLGRGSENPHRGRAAGRLPARPPLLCRREAGGVAPRAPHPRRNQPDWPPKGSPRRRGWGRREKVELPDLYDLGRGCI